MRRKRFFLDQLRTSKGWAVLFQTAAEADLEEQIYNGVTSGDIRTYADLDALAVATFARYGIEAPPEQWTRVRLMFEDPFHDINYTWAAVIALPLFRQAAREHRAHLRQRAGERLSGAGGPVAKTLHRQMAVSMDFVRMRPSTSPKKRSACSR